MTLLWRPPKVLVAPGNPHSKRDDFQNKKNENSEHGTDAEDGNMQSDEKNIYEDDRIQARPPPTSSYRKGCSTYARVLFPADF